MDEVAGWGLLDAVAVTVLTAGCEDDCACEEGGGADEAEEKENEVEKEELNEVEKAVWEVFSKGTRDLVRNPLV